MIHNRKGVSSEALKIAAAMLLALVIFAMLVQFAHGPTKADKECAEIGKEIVNYTQKTAFEVINYANDSE